jgi:dipeptidyl aminopeptidase/acylaminoacyl peptidase
LWLALAIAPGTAGGTSEQKPSQPQAPGEDAVLRTLRPADYGQWERIGFGARLSPDGNWLAVPVDRVDGTAELRVYGLERNAEPIVIQQGSAAAFSEDSRWLACLIGHSEDELAELKEKSKPARNNLALLKLESGELFELENVSAFSFSGSGTFLAYRKYPLEKAAEKPGKDGDEGEKTEATDLIVRVLASGTNVHFGSVSEYAWQDEGDLLALTIESADQAGNAVQLFDPSSGRLRVLDSAPATYKGLAWREDSDDLALFRSQKDEFHEGPTQRVLAWRGLSGDPTAYRLDPLAATGFPLGKKVSLTPGPQWSEAGDAIFIGVQEWREMPAPAKAPEQETTDGKTDGKGEEGSSEAEKKEKISEVQVWHSRDERTIPTQEKNKTRDKERSFLSVWHLDGNRFVQLGSDLMERVSIMRGDRFVTETDRKPYRFDNMFDQSRYDINLVDSESGDRRQIAEEVWHFEGSSPTGRYLLYFKDGHYRVYDIEQDRHQCLTCTVPSSFIDEDYDTPVRKEDPPYGTAGWLKDDLAVLLYDKFDIWAVSPDGSSTVNLTRGAEAEVVHRYQELDPDAKAIDPARAMVVSREGYWTKKQGFAKINLSSGISAAVLTPLLDADKRLSRIIKAKHSSRIAYLAEGFDDSPDYYVTAGGFDDVRQVTQTNPFQKDFAWGRSELIDYRNRDGKRLQAGLYYPADFVAGRKYPMIVYVYERLSQQVHNYTVPSERRPYNETVFTSLGYFVLRPDITYRDRDPGISALDCVTAAVRKALGNQSIDASKVGLVGHSWGGYEASFIPTQTDIFAAAIAGAPLTNFLSFYGTFHWGPGMPESQHFETGQARMDVPYWEDLDAYVRNSPVMSIQNLKTPMMLFFGDADSVVDWHQGVEMYNYARRAGKNLVMLVYPGEDHGARRKENQIDYHRRVLQWFGHYLKGEEAPTFITDGITALEREETLKANQK